MEEEDDSYYVYTSKSMYSIHTTKKTQREAQNDCIRRGGNLASVSSKEENDKLRVQFSEPFWIGLDDRQTEGTFRWVDGKKSNYKNWAGGEPNDWSNEDCVSIKKDGKWNDLDCDSMAQYACKYGGAKFATQTLSSCESLPSDDGKYTVYICEDNKDVKEDGQGNN